MSEILQPRFVAAATTAVTVRPEDTGVTYVMPDLTGDCTFTLPSAANGLKYKWVYAGGAADAQDWIIDTGSDTNYFIGGVLHLDLNAGSAADEVAGVYSAGNSNSKLNILTPAAGTSVEIFCDGTNWYITEAKAVSDTIPTFADQ